MSFHFVTQKKLSKLKARLSATRVAFATAASTLSLALIMPVAAHAATTVVVTPSNTQGWSTADTRPGGAVNFVSDNTSPYPTAALQLTTDSTTTSKAQYLKEASNSINDVSALGYSTKQNSGPSYAAASYQFLVDLNGAGTGGFTTFVYEPYENGTVDTAGQWQTWNVAANDANMWSSRSFSEGSCVTVAGAGGAPYYSLEDIKTNCPDAVVLGFGVNIGSNNPSYDVETDGVVYNSTTFNFELVNLATNKDQCKNNGWKEFGNTYKNQGDCVSSIVSNAKSNRQLEY